MRRVPLLALIALAIPRAAAAQAIEGAGDCPSEPALRAAVQHLDLDGWTLVVDGSTFTLRAPGGAESLRRTLDSTDCPAIAAALGVIIETHLAPLTETRKPTREPKPPAPLPARPSPTPPLPAAPPTVSLSVATGLDLNDTDGSAPFGQADVSFRALGVYLRVALATTGTASQASGMQRVDRSSTTARIEAGARSDAGSWWVRSTAGVGLAASRAVATELPDRPTYIRVHPLISGALVGGRRVAGAWSIRAELAGTGYPVADRYVVDDLGEVGRSPRFTFSFGLGLQVDIE